MAQIKQEVGKSVIRTIKKHREIKSVLNQGVKFHTDTFTIFCLPQKCWDLLPKYADDSAGGGSSQILFATLVTRRTGNAVVRNRIKRRYRSLMRDCCAQLVPQMIYIVLARRLAYDCQFGKLQHNLARSIVFFKNKIPNCSKGSAI